jgi:hypothetical protein
VLRDRQVRDLEIGDDKVGNGHCTLRADREGGRLDSPAGVNLQVALAVGVI